MCYESVEFSYVLKESNEFFHKYAIKIDKIAIVAYVKNVFKSWTWFSNSIVLYN